MHCARIYPSSAEYPQQTLLRQMGKPNLGWEAQVSGLASTCATLKRSCGELSTSHYRHATVPTAMHCNLQVRLLMRLKETLPRIHTGIRSTPRVVVLQSRAVYLPKDKVCVVLLHSLLLTNTPDSFFRPAINPEVQASGHISSCAAYSDQRWWVG